MGRPSLRVPMGSGPAGRGLSAPRVRMRLSSCCGGPPAAAGLCSSDAVAATSPPPLPESGVNAAENAAACGKSFTAAGGLPAGAGAAAADSMC